MRPPRSSDPAAAPARADLRIASLLAACTFLYLLLFVHGHFAGTDEVGVYEQTKSLYEHRDLAVPPGMHTFPGKDGRLYAIFAIGQSAMALPFYGLGRIAESVLPASWSERLAGQDSRDGTVQWGGTAPIFMTGLYGPFMSALLVGLFYLFERSLGVSIRSAVLASALLAATTYVAAMSMFFLQHTTEAVTILGGFLGFHVFKQQRSWAALVGASLVASSTLLIRIPGCFAAPALVGYVASILRGPTIPTRSGRGLLKALGCILVPAAFVALAHMAGNLWKWGTWIRSPYLDQISALTGKLYVGVYGFLLSPGGSIFVYSPLLLLLPWTLPRFWRAHRAECLTVGAIFLGFLLGSSKFEDWTGLYSAPGPRYLFAAIPLLMLPIGGWLDGGIDRMRRVALWTLATVGLVVQIVTMTAHWGDIIAIMSWHQFVPPLGFVWMPDRSPLLGAFQALAQGAVDPWIWKLCFGGPGIEAAPAAALLLLAVWAACLSASLALLRRTLRGSSAT